MKGFLENQTAIITGGARGIGKAIAQRFLSEGARVYLVDMDEEKLKETITDISSPEDEVYKYKCDITDKPSVETMTDSIIRSSKSIDILVNNAGITRDSFLHKMSRSDWDQVIEVNLNGAFNCTRSVINHMREAKHGRIINITSVVALSGNVGQSNYISSKAALIGFTKALALESAALGITVNAIAPGFTATEMINTIPQKVQDKIISKIPLGHFGTPQDIADAALFLASSDSDYITGQTISVNGGYYI